MRRCAGGVGLDGLTKWTSAGGERGVALLAGCWEGGWYTVGVFGVRFEYTPTLIMGAFISLQSP